MGSNERVEKSNAVAKAGVGVGAVLEYDQDTYGNTLIDDAHNIPTAEISYQDSFTLDSYMNSTRAPVGFISPVRTVYGLKPAPAVATFSSRGPNAATFEILKPDVVAPGVNILAAACPRTRDNAGERMRDLYYTDERAGPLDYSAGLIPPNRAVDPGLIYDNTMEDYYNFLCSYSQLTNLTGYTAKPYMGPDPPIPAENINSPSISAPNLNKTQTMTRTVRNVGPPATYRVRWTPPEAANMTVSPTELKFDRTGEEKTYELRSARK
uniref:Subtilisin-like protease fibronectin type-III domain-containing protein n=1 Tax=Ananas comosus var. bracteatus TaxID=296719 RepID=A0A6V7PKN3_ANACO|nr:unnamed protein product [Ananas comosus var. bracteatus]